LFRQVINHVNEQLGIAKISQSQDPYKYIANMQLKLAKEGKTKEQAEGSTAPIKEEQNDTISNFNELIKNSIKDDQDLALYNEILYKGDYEIAFEKGIQYYLFNLNKWVDRFADSFIEDIMNFNKACGEYYTDLVTGRPVLERIEPETLNVSPFSKKDGEDILYYFREYNVTFADFVKTIGASLEQEKLKEVFEYNKTQGAVHGNRWIPSENGRYANYIDNSKIRIGRFACLTQNYDVDMEAVQVSAFGNNDNITWETGMNKKEFVPQSVKHYNVWYNFFYIPPTQNTVGNSDYQWQSKFIFNIKKNQDQLRYGEDGRYSKCPLFMYDNSNTPSFTDIIQSYMPKINFAWFQYENCLVNDIQAVVFSDELIGGLLSAVDEDNKIQTGMANTPVGGNGADAYMEQWKMIKQNGTGFLKLTDKQGNAIIDPSKLQFKIENGLLKKAESYMSQMLILYQQMTQALAINDAREGMDIKPRTSVASIEESLKSSQNATWFIQKSYECLLKSASERMVQYMIDIVKEAKTLGYTKRRDEFFDIVGAAQGLSLEGLEDVPLESIGLNVNYVDNTAKKDFVMQLAIERVKNGLLDDDFLYLIMGTDNYKQSFLLMRLGIKNRKKELEQKEELAHMRQLEIQKQQQQTAAMIQQGQLQGKIAVIDEEGKMSMELEKLKAQVKTMSQSMLLDQRGENKIAQDKIKQETQDESELKKSLPMV